MSEDDIKKRIRRYGEFRTNTADTFREGTTAEILEVFGDDKRLALSLEKDTTRNFDEGLREIYRKLRPGEPPTFDSAYDLIEALFFDAKRYDLAKVGRYKYNKKLGIKERAAGCVLTQDVFDPQTGELLAEAGTKLKPEHAQAIQDAGLEYIFVKSKNNEGKEVKDGKKLPYYVIDTQKCVKCGTCIDKCKFHAISKK